MGEVRINVGRDQRAEEARGRKRKKSVLRSVSLSVCQFVRSASAARAACCILRATYCVRLSVRRLVLLLLLLLMPLRQAKAVAERCT